MPSSGTLPEIGSWVTVKDPASGYTFKLPTKPKVLTPPVTAPDGSPVKIRAYQSLINPTFVVQVSVYDLAGRTFDTDKAINGVATSTRGTVTSRVHRSSGGLDVVDARISLRNGTASSFNRVFKKGDYAVQMQALGLTTDETQIRLAQRLLNASFQGG